MKQAQINDLIRRAVIRASAKEEAIQPFTIYGRDHEARVSLDRGLAAVLRNSGIHRVDLRSHHRQSIFYPRRVFVRTKNSLKRKLGWYPIKILNGQVRLKKALAETLSCNQNNTQGTKLLNLVPGKIIEKPILGAQKDLHLLRAKGFRPAPACAVCSKPHSPASGKRIQSQRECAINVNRTLRSIDHPNSLGGPDLFAFTVEISEFENHPAWDGELLSRCEALVKKLYTPWYCQSCAMQDCPICEKPLPITLGCSILHDDLSIGYQARLPVVVSCRDRSCTGYQPPAGGKWSLR